jgi:hypothetical protein
MVPTRSQTRPTLSLARAVRPGLAPRRPVSLQRLPRPRIGPRVRVPKRHAQLPLPRESALRGLGSCSPAVQHHHCCSLADRMHSRHRSVAPACQVAARHSPRFHRASLGSSRVLATVNLPFRCPVSGTGSRRDSDDGSHAPMLPLCMLWSCPLRWCTESGAIQYRAAAASFELGVARARARIAMDREQNMHVVVYTHTHTASINVSVYFKNIFLF